VPFLIFAIAVSHGVQMVRAYRDAVFSGLDGPAAARVAFRQLIVPGGLALITDTIGFITMLVIPIPTIRELALTASLGVSVIVVTNFFLLRCGQQIRFVQHHPAGLGCQAWVVFF
jgi:predicted RND superfamily exporter protein